MPTASTPRCRRRSTSTASRPFIATADAIELDDAVFAGIGVLGALGAARFHAGAAAADASDRIIDT